MSGVTYWYVGLMLGRQTLFPHSLGWYNEQELIVDCGQWNLAHFKASVHIVTPGKIK